MATPQVGKGMNNNILRQIADVLKMIVAVVTAVAATAVAVAAAMTAVTVVTAMPAAVAVAVAMIMVTTMAAAAMVIIVVVVTMVVENPKISIILSLFLIAVSIISLFFTIPIALNPHQIVEVVHRAIHNSTQIFIHKSTTQTITIHSVVNQTYTELVNQVSCP